MAASAATTATPPFASRQRGGEGLLALKSLASARPAGPRQQRSLREPKPVLSAGKSKILAVGRDAPGQWFGGGKEPRFLESRGARANDLAIETSVKIARMPRFCPMVACKPNEGEHHGPRQDRNAEPRTDSKAICSASRRRSSGASASSASKARGIAR